ncbi:MAG: hypothetical protein ACOCRO_09690 [Halanaerobiales bacterium]
MADYYNNMIHKIDRKGKLLAVKDMTNDEWDITDNNKYIFEFVEYDEKSKSVIKNVQFYVDADEITAMLGQITTGNYSKTIGWHTFFAGSKLGRAKKKVNGKMINIIDGVESRKMTIGINDSGYFVLNVEISPGKVGSRGEIKPAGDSVEKISFGIKALEAVILAKAIETYTIAKKTLGISTYLKNKAEQMKSA